MIPTQISDEAIRRDPRVRAMILAAIAIANEQCRDAMREALWQSEVPKPLTPEQIVDKVLDL